MTSLALLLLSSALAAQEPMVIPLWPGAAPGSESWTQTEELAPATKDGIRRLRNISRPTLTVYTPPAGTANGTAIVVAPGGGFRILAIDYEGIDVARYLNTLGVTAFVLKYRVSRTGDAGEKDPATMAARRKEAQSMATADGQQAIRVVRSRAAEWGLAPDRIGILGFSAGGFVASSVALHHDAASRPSFSAPIYPFVEEDVKVPAGAPPLFLVHADDDKTLNPVDHSVRLYTAWKQAGIPAELHIYSKGGHGFGMRKVPIPAATWTDRLRDWLDTQGLLKPAR
jgi:acetyl esterase/lipase